MTEAPPNPTQRRKKIMWLVILIAVLSGGLGAWVGGTWMLEQAQAKGIAQGYIEAALRAYQTDRYGRPLPDLMLDIEHFLIDTRTSGTPPTMTVKVNHRVLGFTYIEMSKRFEASGRSEAPPPEQAPSR